ncbi:MAG: hypothetical protein R3F45_04200 [Gammaproteobacteria bacterium]
MERYLRDSVSNGNPREQALIRKWWHEQREAKGVMVWEYCIEDRFVDAVLFPYRQPHGTEAPGKSVATRYPISGETIVLCESKDTLNPELIGQALVYRQLAIAAGAEVREVFVFSENATSSMRRIAKELGLCPEVLCDT